MTIQEQVNAIKELALYCVKKEIPTNFENIAKFEDVEVALRDAFKELVPDRYAYERNKSYVFEIIQVAMDEVLPKKVLETVGQFAEVQQFGSQEIARFKIKTGRNRAKQFVTRAALAGVYETFRLDHRYIDVTCHAYGGAAAIDWERYLNGDEDFAEYTAIMMEGLEEQIYHEIWAALKNAATRLQAIGVADADGNSTNYAEVQGDGDTFTAEENAALLRLATTVKRYGNGATFFGTEPILQKFTNGGGDYVPNVPASDLDEIKNTGYIGKWRGNALVTLPNSFTDETNTATVFEDCYGFVFPTDNNNKVVKIALQGNTQVDDRKNRDWSMEIQAYKQFGVAIMTVNNWCMFKVASLDPTTGD